MPSIAWLLQVDSSMALLTAAATAQSDLRRQSIMPPTRLLKARVTKDAPDLSNVTVRCASAFRSPVELLLRVRPSNVLEGHTACCSREAHFRTKFQASIVSIRREGHKLDSKLGDVVLQAKDEILFDCGDDFDETSDIVQQNLKHIGVVENDSEREFMVAFEVLGLFQLDDSAAISPVQPQHTECEEGLVICFDF